MLHVALSTTGAIVSVTEHMYNKDVSIEHFMDDSQSRSVCMGAWVQGKNVLTAVLLSGANE